MNGSGVWGHFSESGRRTPPDRYWNVFGQQPMRLRQNMLVEINPPGNGKNLNRQGVLARDGHGHRWLLHQGRLHPRGVRITEDMFDAVATARRVDVRYADGAVASCHRVADLDQPPNRVQNDVAAFVDLCARIRVHYQLGEAARQMLERINAAEAPSSPERQGAYALPAMPPRTAERRHADIWHALVKKLDALGIQHANSRFGRYGPDLFAHIARYAAFRDQGRRDSIRHPARSRAASALRAPRRSSLQEDHGAAGGTTPCHRAGPLGSRHRTAALPTARHHGASRSAGLAKDNDREATRQSWRREGRCP